ncbi:CBS domain-containing protein [Bacillus infantis]|uniref:CBS domain-containing protein n=1 Tax=Bacillus infantis TaxID=324767 RepID=UPI002FBDFC0D
MNIAFFLLPKNELVFVYDHWTMRQAMEKMEYHRYTTFPILNKEGKYVGSLSEGDLLWKLKSMGRVDFNEIQGVMLKDVPLHRSYEPVLISSEMEEIINSSLNQNFVPVTDDSGVFIGLIRRREIIDYLAGSFKERDLSVPGEQSKTT